MFDGTLILIFLVLVIFGCIFWFGISLASTHPTIISKTIFTALSILLILELRKAF